MATRAPWDDCSEQRAIDEILAFVDTLGAQPPGSSLGATTQVIDPATGLTSDLLSPEPIVESEHGRGVGGDDGDCPADESSEADRGRLSLPSSPSPSSPSSASASSSSLSRFLSVAPMPTLTPPAQAAPPTKRRRRQKQELDYLRVHVRELEDELQRLRSEAMAACVTGSLQEQFPDRQSEETNTSAGNEDDRVLTTMAARPRPEQSTFEWEALARREKAAAELALMENIQLRAVLEGQLSIARAFESALHRRNLTAAEVMPYLSRSQSTASVGLATDEQVYASLGRNLDALYAQVDAVLASWRPPTPAPGCAAHHTDIRSGARGMYLEHRVYRVLPFTAHRVGQAVWDTARGGKFALDTGVCMIHDHTEDSLCAKVVDTFRLSKSSSKETLMTMRVSMKRFVETTRVVLVWESLVETVGQICLQQREHAWTAFRPVPGDELEQVCEAISCIRVRPEMVASDADEGIDIGLLSDLVVSSYQRNFGSMAAIVHEQLQ